MPATLKLSNLPHDRQTYSLPELSLHSVYICAHVRTSETGDYFFGGYFQIISSRTFSKNKNREARNFMQVMEHGLN